PPRNLAGTRATPHFPYTTLFRSDEPLDVAAQVDLLDALFFAGRMREAHEIATAEVAAADDPIRRDCLLLEEAIIGMYLEPQGGRSEEHTSELQSLAYLVCRLLLE